MSDIEAEFVDHGLYRRVDAQDDAEGAVFEPTSNDWSARTVVGDETVEVAVTVPTLSAVVDEPVADVVEDGWYDTFERRVVDADSVTLADDVTVTSVSRADGDVVVELTLTPRQGKAADDALALVNYVEGTWFQGVIPGYDYVEQVQSMRERAAQNGQGSSI
ncbi:DUF5813 family protein [Halobacterium wangiae]|uniref:DUF5813 family protein n=1 Tax=Halobacterium wangiae TaxID=2902623 RepID=UPI001E4F7A13|nr:DUF5813 family protein [Halobacterium wangiae]